MLSKNLTIEFEDVRFENVKTFSKSPETIENVSRSEDGHDLVEFVRAGKKKFSFSFTLTEGKAAILEALCEYPSGTLKINNVSYEGRLRGFSAELIYLSQWATSNIYNCSCEFIEA